MKKKKVSEYYIVICYMCNEENKIKKQEKIRSEFHPDLNMDIYFCSKKCAKKFEKEVKKFW